MEKVQDFSVNLHDGKGENMQDTEYTFKIDIFTPDSLPMARLAEYLAALAELVGYEDSTHFVAIQPGSAKLVHKVDAPDAPKVERRLAEVSQGVGPRDAQRAFKTIDDLLSDDNAVGQLTRGDAVVIPFPGRTRPKPLTFPAFRQVGTIDGEVVRVGGQDSSAHVILQDGSTVFSGCTLSRELARELAQHLYSGKVRLFGEGRWERRPDGSWKLLDFKVDRFETLDDTPLSEVFRDLRSIAEPTAGTGIFDDLMRLRGSDGEVH